MYEDMTYDFIRNRMLNRIISNYPEVDTREGSMIFNAIAPEALELAMAYTELDSIRNESFIDTASRDSKIKLCEQQGLDTTLFEAKAGIFKGVFNVEIEIDSRWNCDPYNYTVVEYTGFNDTTQYYEYELQCETPGIVPNAALGRLTPITDAPKGLTYAELTDILIEGEPEWSDDEIVTYYFNNVNGTATDGNVEQYKMWCDEYPSGGIGKYKIFPLWNGNNTVKVSILSTSEGIATNQLIDDFQTWLDPCTTEKATVTKTNVTIQLEGSPHYISHIFWTLEDGSRALIPPEEYTYNEIDLITINSSYANEHFSDSGTTCIVNYGNGMGDGKAPIGAFVTVSTATGKNITVSAQVKVKDGYTDTYQTEIGNKLTSYFAELAYTNSFVNYMSVGAQILSCESIETIVTGTLKLNGGENDIQLGDEEIPVFVNGGFTNV